ncbi:MAG: hypothetical protein EBV64_06970 [Oxalobacteraceae bacterium]|nr:hypothetical protein [Oxalobacteraceae bacterium]
MRHSTLINSSATHTCNAEKAVSATARTESPPSSAAGGRCPPNFRTVGGRMRVGRSLHHSVSFHVQSAA